MTQTTPTISATNQDTNNRIYARYPTSEEQFYAAWGQEIHRGGWKLTHDSFRDLIAINTVLVGGAIALLDNKVVHPTVRLWVVGFFFISLLISLSALLPYSEKIDLSRIDQLEVFYKRTMRSRTTKIWASAIALAAGLTIALIGMICHQ